MYRNKERIGILSEKCENKMRDEYQSSVTFINQSEKLFGGIAVKVVVIFMIGT